MLRNSLLSESPARVSALAQVRAGDLAQFCASVDLGGLVSAGQTPPSSQSQFGRSPEHRVPKALVESSSLGWVSDFHTVRQPALVALEQSNLIPQTSSMIFLHGSAPEPVLATSNSSMTVVTNGHHEVASAERWTSISYFNFRFGGSTTAWLSIPPDNTAYSYRKECQSRQCNSPILKRFA